MRFAWSSIGALAEGSGWSLVCSCVLTERTSGSFFFSFFSFFRRSFGFGSFHGFLSLPVPFFDPKSSRRWSFHSFATCAVNGVGGACGGARDLRVLFAVCALRSCSLSDESKSESDAVSSDEVLASEFLKRRSRFESFPYSESLEESLEEESASESVVVSKSLSESLSCALLFRFVFLFDSFLGAFLFGTRCFQRWKTVCFNRNALKLRATRDVASSARLRCFSAALSAALRAAVATCSASADRFSHAARARSAALNSSESCVIFKFNFPASASFSRSSCAAFVSAKRDRFIHFCVALIASFTWLSASFLEVLTASLAAVSTASILLSCALTAPFVLFIKFCNSRFASLVLERSFSNLSSAMASDAASAFSKSRSFLSSAFLLLKEDCARNAFTRASAALVMDCSEIRASSLNCSSSVRLRFLSAFISISAASNSFVFILSFDVKRVTSSFRCVSDSSTARTASAAVRLSEDSACSARNSASRTLSCASATLASASATALWSVSAATATRCSSICTRSAARAFASSDFKIASAALCSASWTLASAAAVAARMDSDASARTDSTNAFALLSASAMRFSASRPTSFAARRAAFPNSASFAATAESTAACTAASVFRADSNLASCTANSTARATST